MKIKNSFFLATLAAMLSFVSYSYGADILWGNTAPTWSSGAAWVGGIAPANSLTGNIAVFNNTTFTSNPVVANAIIEGLRFGNNSSQTGALTFGSGGLTIGASGILITGAGASPIGKITTAGGFVLGASQTWTNNGYVLANGTAALYMQAFTTAQNLGNISLTLNGNGTSGLIPTTIGGTNYAIDLAGIASQGSGTTLTLNIAMTGNGLVSLNQANNFSGGLNILSGVAQLSNANSAGSGTITLGDTSGNLDARIIGGGVTIANAINVSGGTTGTLTIGGLPASSSSPTYSGLITLNNNLVIINESGSNTSYTLSSGGITGTGNLILKNNGIGFVTLNGSINNVGSITNNSTGTGVTTINGNMGSNVTNIIQNSSTSIFKLTGVNTYTGTTTINAGTLQLNSVTGNITATTAININGGTFELNNTGAGVGVDKSQTVGNVSFQSNDSVIKINNAVTTQKQILTLNGISRSEGGTGTFWVNGGTNSATNGIKINGQPTGVLGNGYFYETTTTNVGYAYYDTTGYIRAIAYGTDATSGSYVGGVSIVTPYLHQGLSGNLTAQTTQSFDDLRISGTNTNITLATNAILTTNGIIKSATTASTSIITGGAGIQAGLNTELIINPFSGGATADSLYINNTIKENGINALTKTGYGYLFLSGDNKSAGGYTGTTYVTNGILTLNNINAQASGQIQVSQSGTLGLGVKTGDSNYFTTTDIQNLFNNTLAGVTLNSNSGIAINTSENTGIFDYNNILTGNRNLNKLGDNTLLLSADNSSYSGVITVIQGTLKITNGNQLGNTTGNTMLGISNISALEIDGTSNNVIISDALTIRGTGVNNEGAIKSIGNNTITGSTTAAAAARINSNAGTLTFNGTIATNAAVTLGGTGDFIINANVGTNNVLTKDGTGTVLMNYATNNNAGGILISAGTLLLNGGAGFSNANGTITVGGNATFGGNSTATIAKSIVVNDYGTLRVGSGTAATGTLTSSGNLTMGNASGNTILAFALGAGGNHTTLTRTGGTWVFDANQQVSFVNIGGLATTGNYTGLITGLIAAPSDLANWRITNSGFQGAFLWDGSSGINFRLDAVPEPSTWALLVGAGVFLLMVVRRRRMAPK